MRFAVEHSDAVAAHDAHAVIPSEAPYRGLQVAAFAA